MCGRYAFSRLDQHLLERLELDPAAVEVDSAPRYNLAPGGTVAALRILPAGRRLQALRWGFPAGPRPLANARAEGVAGRRSFADAFQARQGGRCLLPCDGWYEWDAGRQPWFIRPREAEVSLMAGLWTPAADGPVCCVLTCAAAASLEGIHPRMPVLLPEELWADWLAGAGNGADWAPRLLPWPADQLECWEVGLEVNRATVDHPGLAAPAAARQGRLF